MLKAWSPDCGATGRWWNLSEAEPSGRRLGHWASVLEGDTGTYAPTLVLGFLATKK